jgi:hypothetical protein
MNAVKSKEVDGDGVSWVLVLALLGCCVTVAPMLVLCRALPKFEGLPHKN